MWMDLKMLLHVWELWRENGLFKKKREVKIYWNSKIFMTKKINQGESTEFKCEPEEVAREMKSV